MLIHFFSISTVEALQHWYSFSPNAGKVSLTDNLLAFSEVSFRLSLVERCHLMIKQARWICFDGRREEKLNRTKALTYD
jgi:hypothetical protein